MKFLAGKKISAVTPQGEKYLAFLPESINRDLDWQDKNINLLLETARGWVGELNAYSKLIPNVDYFIQSYVAKEAEQSSRIEGTKTTLEELYLGVEDIRPERVDDQEEVKNYIKALNYSIEKIYTEGEPPLSQRLICEAHKLLLSGVRGYKRRPGEIRKIQNKIGGEAGTLKDAVYIPPIPEDVPDLMKDLEDFWHNKNLEIPELIKVALAHYQFETIHPFEDGNGRLGRLIITLQLVSYGILSKPTLYLSDFFEKNRASYYDALSAVRVSNNIEHWIKFFLNGVAITAKKAKDTLEKIIDLNKRYESRIYGGLGPKRQKLAIELLKMLYGKPVVTAKEVEEMLNVSKPTAHALVSDLSKQEVFILKEKTGLSRNRIYVLHEYLDLFDKH